MTHLRHLLAVALMFGSCLVLPSAAGAGAAPAPTPLEQLLDRTDRLDTALRGISLPVCGKEMDRLLARALEMYPANLLKMMATRYSLGEGWAPGNAHYEAARETISAFQKTLKPGAGPSIGFDRRGAAVALADTLSDDETDEFIRLLKTQLAVEFIAMMDKMGAPQLRSGFDAAQQGRATPLPSEADKNQAISAYARSPEGAARIQRIDMLAKADPAQSERILALSRRISDPTIMRNLGSYGGMRAIVDQQARMQPLEEKLRAIARDFVVASGKTPGF